MSGWGHEDGSLLLDGLTDLWPTALAAPSHVARFSVAVLDALLRER